MDAETYVMREACKNCGCVDGYIDHRNGQACIFCSLCGKYQYNAPKHERGLAPTPLRQDGIKSSVRHEVKVRANFRCEGCGSLPTEKRMDIGHRVLEKDWREAGLPPLLVRDFDNLAWLCDDCNLGQSSKSIPIPASLLFKIHKAVRDGNGS